MLDFDKKEMIERFMKEQEEKRKNPLKSMNFA
jgi:hypothetical protein